MPSISSRTFSEALRRAYPCCPLLLLGSGCVVVRGAPGAAAAGVESGKMGNGTDMPLIAPLASSVCYCVKGEAHKLLLDLTQRHDYGSPLFLLYQDNQSLPDSGSDTHTRQLPLTVDGPYGEKPGVSVARTPRIRLQLMRCTLRVNLTDCMKTRILQEELRRTESELCLLYRRAHPPSGPLAGEKPPLTNVLPTDAATPVQLSHPLQLVWEKTGWYFEDSAVATEQMKRRPLTSRSGGYWSAWLKPFRAPFTSSFMLHVRDIQEFFVEEDVTLVNVEAAPRFLEEGHTVPFSRRHLRKALDYWASTGELVEPVDAEDSGEAAAHAADGGDENRQNRHFSAKDCCWFTVAELAERQLKIRPGGTIFPMPVRHDGCGFFLHEAPRWFLLSWAEVLRACPLSLATVANIPFALECGGPLDIMAAAECNGPHCGEFVFVLHETGEWHAYPRRHGIFNFYHRVPYKSEFPFQSEGEESSHAALPLLFVDINAAVRLMRDWSRHQEIQQQKPCAESEEVIAQYKQLKTFFASLPSALSAATFVSALVERCATTVKCPPPSTFPMRRDAAAVSVETCSKGMPTLPHTLEDNGEPSFTVRRESHRHLTFYPDNDEDISEDFPAVDRRVHTPGQRLCRAYTHPRNEQRQRDHAISAQHIDPTVAQGIIDARCKREKAETMLKAPGDTIFMSGEHDDGHAPAIWDLGIAWLSFSYNVPAVNAFDTEVMP
ncbi:hypothetical protein DQ04_10191000 [Trypanosoma grayi]|uniref:hypothetical protein n=1 Tax=Trypanosoma grayi TaxID=71804 RepID=UPI0004F46E72|nr:hypothetical protein DQ04_10191000 [Trypanosoma grayi]KEG07317.1 hypothetical protein DQ04_10191000 [Trypanosoma grayi]